MKARNFSADEHIEVGTLLLAMDKQIHALAIRIGGVYGKTSYEAKRAQKMRRDLLLIRSELESRLAREHRSFVHVTHVYFGSEQAREHFGIIAKIPPLL